MDERTVLGRVRLEPEERIMWQGKPIRGAYVLVGGVGGGLLTGLFMILIGGFFVAMVLGPMQEDADRPPALILITMSLVFGTIGAGMTLLGLYMVVGRPMAAFLAYRNIAYALTNRRVLIRRGLISFSWESVELEDVRHTEVRMTVADRLYHTGTVRLLTRAEGWREGTGCNQAYTDRMPELVSLADPFGVQAMIREASAPLKRDE